MNSSLIISDHPLQVLPGLAVAIGLNEAIVLQQFHYFQEKGVGMEIDGEKWVYDTYEALREKYFKFWSVDTLQRIVVNLEKCGWLNSIQPEGGISRRKYYRVSFQSYKYLTVENLKEMGAARLGQIKIQKQVAVTKTASCGDGDGKLRSSTNKDEDSYVELRLNEIQQEQPEPKSDKEREAKVESLYKLYPKKIARGAAIRAIEKAMNKVPYEKLLESVTEYSAAVARWPEQERRFVPNPATWFNQECWDDDRSNWRRSSGSQPVKIATIS